ncbi:MAG: iron chaperone [Bryobacteraceae bacterium]
MSVDEYLAGLPEPARTTLEKLRAVIRTAAPKETEEVISYGMPALRYNGPLVYYAAFAGHCSFFPGSKAVIEQFKDELAGYSIAKGTIRFPLDKPLPSSLVKKMVTARVAQNELKKKR